MKNIKIPSKTALSPLGKPRFHEGGQEAVLLIHGFRGIAQEFYYLFDRIAEAGYTVSLPRLPGHGTNAADFHASGAEDWLRRVTDEYLLLRTKYEKVHIAGLSMGGLLTLILAEEFNPASIAVMAPAISIRHKMIKLVPVLKHFIPYLPAKWDETREEDPLRQELGREYWAQTDTRKLSDMMALRKIALKNLRKVESRTLTIVSEADKTVAPDAVEIISKGIRSKQIEQIILKESPHVLVDGCEREEVADRLLKWFKQE
ncbi:MAG: alpha/beta fold hydrolase [Spirochaetales bacterium]|nr:alpha/beta fold hydrolase [Spirochaetales bacterium]